MGQIQMGPSKYRKVWGYALSIEGLLDLTQGTTVQELSEVRDLFG